MIEALKKKYNKDNGFTLVELLIVVAIIAILIAISIPLVSSSLSKAENATNDANVRSAKAAATIMALDDGSAVKGKKMVYNAATGVLAESPNASTINAYGQGTKKGNRIWISFDKDSDAIKYMWSSATTAPDTGYEDFTITATSAATSATTTG